jgi:hypothetical protein
MTIVILDRPPGPMPPYLKWLGDGTADVILLTGRSAAEIADNDTAGYADLRRFDDYTTSAEVERTVLRIAESTCVSAIVAIHNADLIRSGALRDRLGLPGQGRADAIATRDLVAQRRRLDSAGIATVPFCPVRRVMDLYWYANRQAWPLRVRRRRATGWPTVAVLEDEAAAVRFTQDGLVPALEAAPSLVADSAVAGEQHRVSVPEELTARVRAALAAPDGARQTVEAVQTSDGDWLVDSVACDLGNGEAVRAQAGLTARPEKVTR